jgi:membrane protease subunit HflC
MKKRFAVVAGLLLLILLALFSTTFTVRFHEVAIRTRFARTTPDSIVTKPGLHFRLPLFADRVTKIDTRLQMVQSPLKEIKTRDDQSLLVQAFLLWQVDATQDGDGPLRFFRKYSTIEQARLQLEDVFSDRMGVLSQFAFDDLIGEGSRLKDAEQMLLGAMSGVEDAGVRPVTVGISQVLLPAKTTTAVLRRMEQTRKKLAEDERAAGMSEATRLQAEARTKLDKIRSVVQERAEQIRAQGDVKAAAFFSQMAQYEEFAIFLVQLSALEKALSEYTTFVLSDQNAPWHFINLLSPKGEDGIPSPRIFNQPPLPPGAFNRTTTSPGTAEAREQP